MSKKISFCTTCMGYLDKLGETMPKNLAMCKDHGNSRLVILAYGDLETYNWVSKEFPNELESGEIVLAHTEAQHFDMAHAKNMVAKIGSLHQPDDHIIVNMDADNYSVKGFPGWLEDTFQRNPQTIALPSYFAIKLHESLGNKLGRGIHGRIATTAETFHKLHGYHEIQDAGWGEEDEHFIARAYHSGITCTGFPRKYIGQVLNHSNEQRIDNYSAAAKAESSFKLGNGSDTKSSSELKQERHKKLLIKLLKQTAALDFRKPFNLVEEIPNAANPGGNYGCGTVDIYQPDRLELETITFTPKPHVSWVGDYKSLTSSTLPSRASR